MIDLDPDVDWHVVWVPGTWGDDVHVGFGNAVQDKLGGKAQIHVVKYPASPDFGGSVVEGRMALEKLLREIGRYKQSFQKIIVSGSSQGSWVIHDAMVSPVWEVVHRTATFGLPGMSNHAERQDDQVWDITSPYDAVTWEWRGVEKRIIGHASALVQGKWWHLFPLLPYLVLNPFPTFGMIGLLMTHFKAPRLSPHDYTPVMPVAVAWMTN